MKFGVHYGALPKGTPYHKGFALLKEAGADCVELVMREKSPLYPDITDAELIQIRKIAEEVGLVISGVTNVSLWETPLTANDPSIREKGIRSIFSQIRIAEALGAEDLLIIPGYAGTTYVPASEKVPYDIAVQRSFDGIIQAIPCAEKAGVRLCVENVWNRMLLSPLELASFADRFNSHAAGLYFDTGNAMLYGDPEIWIPLLGTRIKSVHIKDAVRHLANVSAFVPLGQGDVPFHLVREALTHIGYDGNFILEVHYPISYEKLQREVQTMRCLMG